MRGQSTVFGSALLASLESSVANTTPSGHDLQTITIESLSRDLRKAIAQIIAGKSVNQHFVLEGLIGDLDRPLLTTDLR